MIEVHKEDAAEHARLMDEAPDAEDEACNRLMDATQTLIQLKVGDVLTQEMIADLHLVDQDHRDEYDRAVDAFHKGYEAGLERGAGADTAKLIHERDEARNEAMVARSLTKIGGASLKSQLPIDCIDRLQRWCDGAVVNDDQGFKPADDLRALLAVIGGDA